MEKDFLIPNPSDLEIKIKKISKLGVDKFHVLSDFDRTLTRAFVNGKKIPSVISELRTGHYISGDYSEKSSKLAEKYHSIEINPNIPIDIKKKAMNEWWRKHFNLLIESGLNKKHLSEIVEKGNIIFRQGDFEFLDYLYEKKVPLVIMSSSGLGGDSIKMFLKKYDRLYNNIFVISNEFEWDEKGRAVKVKEPIISVLNKNEFRIRGTPIYAELSKRKNVLLLGDGLGDLGMISGFDYDNLIKVGFCNYYTEENLNEFKKNFDAIILNDGNMNLVNDLVKRMI